MHVYISEVDLYWMNDLLRFDYSQLD